ncbi:MAG: NAD-dependent epimerase/dehydratase family protein [Planctomycetes bacterium]|nr:NAD-dependent epimerase/dehydratase family protein [Planctomycetota bacterium]
MKVLITGGAGFLGGHVVRAAVQAGHEVRALVRPAALRDLPPGVRPLAGDLNDRGCVRQAVRDVEGIIFSAGRNWRPGLPPAAYQAQNVGIVQTFFAALAEVNPSARVVFTSSMSAVAGSLAPLVFTEETGRQGVCLPRLNPYDRAKVECERLAHEAATRGSNIVILNPGFMLGPGASPETPLTTPLLIQWFCLRKNPVYVRTGGHSYCDVRDVAAAHVAALDKGARGGQYFVGGENLDAVQFQRLLAGQTGVPCPRRVRAWLPSTAMTVLDFLAAGSFGLWKNPVHRTFARSLPLYYWGDSSRAERDLGYRSRPAAWTVRDTIGDLVRRGELPDEFRFVEAMTDADRPALLLLRQLADRHLHRLHLMPRLAAILAAARHNQELGGALDRLLAVGRYDPDRGRYVLRGQGLTAAAHKLRGLLDYVYYASKNFHRKVSSP